MTTGALPLAGRMGAVALSPIMKGTIAAERLRRQGADVVDLGAGEPDFPTPDHVRAAAHVALDQSFTKYTANAGVLELRDAVARRYREDHGVTYAADDVLITAGGKQALFHAAMALFGPGDEVITHVPGWPTISRAGQARRRDARGRAHARRGRVRDYGGRPSLGHHASHARHHHQLANQPDRRADVRRSGAGGGGRRGAPRSRGWSSISATTVSSTTARRIASPGSSATPCTIGWSCAARRRRATR